MRDTGYRAKHTIPHEIVKKIVSKIEAGQRFTVYITIPMFPEGDPVDGITQEILYWQVMMTVMTMIDVNLSPELAVTLCYKCS